MLVQLILLDGQYMLMEPDCTHCSEDLWAAGDGKDIWGLLGGIRMDNSRQVSLGQSDADQKREGKESKRHCWM